MIRITCTSCQKQLSLDETKLPPSAVTFPCPVCKAKLTVDKRQHETGARAPQELRAEEARTPDDYSDEEHQIGDKALIVERDSPVLREAAKLINLVPIVRPTAAAAREYYLRDFPAVVFINPAQLTPPPLAEYGTLLSVSPADRRRGFFILVAENLRTHDGNAAFLYGVDLIVATKDLPSFPVIYREAEAVHTRMYQAMIAAFSGVR